MKNNYYVPFTKEMKKDYTILVPNMLPMHFKLIISVLKTHGYNIKLLETSGQNIVDTGLKYTHNDACYPAVLVIGQFMDAILNGGYNPQKTALMMFQTGGGCRASNYISLIRKALLKAGYPYIPVISFSLAGIEKHPGFTLTPQIIVSMIYGVLYADLLMHLKNQIEPYEKIKGSAKALSEKWTDILGEEMGKGKTLTYKKFKDKIREIIKDFKNIKCEKRDTVKVGIVGEIFVKYSPLGNNNLEKFLVSEGAEVVLPGLCDFILYVMYNQIVEYKVYGRRFLLSLIMKPLFKTLCHMKNNISKIINETSDFKPYTPFEKVTHMADGIIHTTVKMGEGWLLTAEMMELYDSGCENIVCTQPFGCLPNHICGKGMMKPIKEQNKNINIVAIDYDPGASKVNQENRLKLMLANARRRKEI